jgi:serine/threonine protein kinase
VSFAPGTRLGAYEILAFIDEGGMGKVYRARDTRLKREVAIKVLPESVATDPERLARFQREAEVLASLNHPHIAAIYGLEQTDGVQALVMELVEGPTLADHIAQGPIPSDEALRIAKQIAEALEAAHRQGIIHRDRKPANIKVRLDGTVKVLDFGVAKLAETSAVGASGQNALSMSPTITSPALISGVGVLLGTAGYMSPEQAKGKPADKRSDIWAFGCVLYEMLTGTRAFEGTDVPETLAAVLRSEPAWAALPAMLVPSVRAFLYRCLEKERKQRVADIRDVRLALEGAFELSSRTDATGAPLWKRLVPVGAALLVGVVGSAALQAPTTQYASPADVAALRNPKRLSGALPSLIR